MKAILLAAIGVTIALMVMREQPPSEPPAKPAPIVQAAPAPAKAVPAPKPAPARRPIAAVAKSDVKRIPAPVAAPLVLKLQEPPPEVIPAAAVAPAVESVAAQPPEPGPDSVFGWGPWSGGAPQAGGAGRHVPPEDAVARAQGAVQSVRFAPPGQQAAPGSPAASSVLPPVVPPPQTVRPGHGWGDKNHLHVHRRGR